MTIYWIPDCCSMQIFLLLLIIIISSSFVYYKTVNYISNLSHMCLIIIIESNIYNQRPDIFLKKKKYKRARAY
jgi:hypothetical protein